MVINRFGLLFKNESVHTDVLSIGEEKAIKPYGFAAHNRNDLVAYSLNYLFLKNIGSYKIITTTKKTFSFYSEAFLSARRRFFCVCHLSRENVVAANISSDITIKMKTVEHVTALSVVCEHSERKR